MCKTEQCTREVQIQLRRHSGQREKQEQRKTPQLAHRGFTFETSKGPKGTCAMSHPVVLHVYDLSQGLAKQMSPMLLGKTIGTDMFRAAVMRAPGDTHRVLRDFFGQTEFGTPACASTACKQQKIKVYTVPQWFIVSYCEYREYFFGGGIQAMPHDEVVATFGMRAVQKIDLGFTDIPKDVFMEFLLSVRCALWVLGRIFGRQLTAGCNGAGTASLRRRTTCFATIATISLTKSACSCSGAPFRRVRCGNPADDCLSLCETVVPLVLVPDITGLPSEVLSTPFGAMIGQMMTGMQQNMRSHMHDPFSAMASTHLPPPVVAPAPGTSSRFLIFVWCYECL
jgi:hypothetical protein